WRYRAGLDTASFRQVHGGRAGALEQGARSGRHSAAIGDIMDTQEQHDRGLALRTELFGREAVEQRMNAFGEFGKPLQHIINAYAYGDVWQRSALPLATKSLTMVAMMAAAGHANELRVHLKGAVKNGCTMEQIQEVLLL